MKLKRTHLLWLGPLTVAIEWTGLFIGSFYLKGFDFNNALSTLTGAQAPLPLIFATTLILAGLTYVGFCLALKRYSANIPIMGVLSGIFLALTGIIAYTGHGGIGDLLHNLVITIAIIGYSCVIYLMKDHPMGAIQQASVWLFRVFIFGIALAIVALYMINRYIAFAQLFILLIIQIWTIIIVWHERRFD